MLKTSSLKKLRETPGLARRAAQWFHEKWDIPTAVYLESIQDCIAHPQGIPQWYLFIGSQGEIVAGAGLIANDFHDRPDLTPNLCALYVEPPCRKQGIAKCLLDAIRQDAYALGFQTLYLITDHTAFYERCGWSFLTMVNEDAGTQARLYAAPTQTRELP